MKSYVIIDSSNLIFSGIYACMTKAGVSSTSAMEQYFSTRLTDVALINSKLIKPDTQVKYIFVEDGYKGNTKKSNILRSVTNEGYKANRDASVEVTEWRESDGILKEEKTRKKIDFNKGKDALYSVINRLTADSNTIVNIVTEEADDIIASIVEKIKMAESDYSILIVSADVDILQLSNSKNVSQYSHIRREILDLSYLKKTLGLDRFEDIVMYKSFLGDSGDNINIRFCAVKNRVRASAVVKIINENPGKNLYELADIIESTLVLDNPINRDHLQKINSIVKLDPNVELPEDIIEIKTTSVVSNDDLVFI